VFIRAYLPLDLGSVSECVFKSLFRTLMSCHV